MTTYFEKNIKPKHRDAYWEDGKVFILSQDGYELAGEINWLDDPFQHRSWRWLFNNFKWMDTLLHRYLFEGDMNSIDKCVEYFESWYSFYILGNKGGEFLWKDDAVSFRAFRIAVVARYILNCSEAPDVKKEMARNAVSLHYNELIDEKKFKRNNHGLFQVRGLMTLSAIHPDIVSLEDAAIYAKKKINYLWLQQYGKQGLHLENSTGYHQLTIKEFDEIIKSPEFTNVSFVYNSRDITKAVDNTKYLYHPNGVSTLFGDSNLSIKKELPKFLGDRIFNEAGYAFLAGFDNSEKNSYLALRTGFPSNIHRHSDDFTFEWSEMGQVILQDSGRYSYEYDNPYRMFFTSPRAHNTVSVNGESFPWWGHYKKNDFYKGAISFYEGNPESAIIEVEKEFSGLEVKFCRRLKLLRGKSLIVDDSMTSDSEKTYEQWFHLSESFDYCKQELSDDLIFKSDLIKLTISPPDDVEVSLVKGQVEPFIQGWVSYKEKQVKPRWSICFKAKGKSSFFFSTTFSLESI